MKFLKMLMYENNELSLTRSLAIAGWVAFLAVSVYLVLEHQYWQNYDTFASITGGGGGAIQVANKLINSKYNSRSGGYGEEHNDNG